MASVIDRALTHARTASSNVAASALARSLLRNADARASPNHWSHDAAVALLAPYALELGPAYGVVHLIARWSIETATTDDPAPHLLTTQWTLAEATGKSRRTVARHLSEEGHAWSATVRRLVATRTNLGIMQVGDSSQVVVVGTVIRFFPEGRRSPNARVRRYGERDLIAEADAGCTAPTRRAREGAARYARGEPRMSPYSPVTEQAKGFNWVMRYLGPPEPREPTAPVNLYGDIPRQHVLSALRLEFEERLALAKLRGSNVWRTCHRWVELAARTLAQAFGDRLSPAPASAGADRPCLAGDGYTGFWLRILWATVRTQVTTGDVRAWAMLQRMCALAVEAAADGVRKPVALAWTIIKREGFAEILRDDRAAFPRRDPRSQGSRHDRRPKRRS